MPEESNVAESAASSIWRYAKLVCSAVILMSVLSCVVMAAIRSVGLTHVTITALDKDAEPRDHDIPFIKQKDALPDYRVTVNTTVSRINLGAKPNQSATDGLTWQLPDPVSTTDIASIRLDDQDKLLSDAIAEVQITDDTITDGNYKFDFGTARSFSVGLQSFFGTPVGIAIASAFTIAILLLIFGLLATIAG